MSNLKEIKRNSLRKTFKERHDLTDKEADYFIEKIYEIITPNNKISEKDYDLFYTVIKEDLFYSINLSLEEGDMIEHLSFSILYGNLLEDVQLLKEKKKFGITKDLIKKFTEISERNLNDFIELFLSDENEKNYSTNVYLSEQIFSEVQYEKLKERRENFEKIKNRALDTKSKYSDKWEIESELPERYYYYEFPENFDKYFDKYLESITYVSKDWINLNEDNIQYKENLIDIVNKVKNYFSGFLTNSVFVYEYKSCKCESLMVFTTPEELIEFCSKLTNCALFTITVRKAKYSFDCETVELTTLKEPTLNYVLRFAKLPSNRKEGDL